MSHLRFAGQPFEAQRDALFALTRQAPQLMAILDAARALALPDWWLVSRAIFEAKAARQARLWPELTIVPWPELVP